LALKLDSLNRIRKILTKRTLREVREKALREEDSSFVVVWDENWHPGILGIVAGRLAGELGKPVGVFSVGKSKAVGSLRSSEDISIYEGVSKLSEMFIKWGAWTSFSGTCRGTNRAYTWISNSNPRI